MISVQHVKAARAVPAWSHANLAKASGVSAPTIARRASTDRPVCGLADIGSKISTAREAAGVIFVEENGEGLGVSLGKRKLGEEND